MTWRQNELWLETDVLWFREALPAPALAADALDVLLRPVATGLEASRQRRLTARAARRRRLATRTVPAVALVVGSATMLPIAWLRHGEAAGVAPLQEDPPSLTLRLDDLFTDVTAVEAEVRRGAGSILRAPVRSAAAPAHGRVADLAGVEWRRATSVGLPYSGRLIHGTQLPVEGPDWVTWDPVTDRRPNLPTRLYGNERTIRTVISVIAAYRAAHPKAPRVVVGDISRRDGGTMDDHVSHQNGLDVDVYYPRRDHRLRAPVAVRQIDHYLAQDLLNRFVAAGAQMVFVGYSAGLNGPGGVVIPYPNHDNHMHVRFPPPAR